MAEEDEWTRFDELRNELVVKFIEAVDGMDDLILKSMRHKKGEALFVKFDISIFNKRRLLVKSYGQEMPYQMFPEELINTKEPIHDMGSW